MSGAIGLLVVGQCDTAEECCCQGKEKAAGHGKEKSTVKGHQSMVVKLADAHFRPLTDDC
jgi:hypothetical protein